MRKLTSKMKPTHNIGLENRRINYFEVRSTTNEWFACEFRLLFSPLFPKTCQDGFQSDIGLARVLAHFTPDWTQLAAHGPLL